MSKVSQSVLEAIQKDAIRPKPRWQFVTWRCVFWLFFIVSVFLGGGATSILFHEILGTEWGLIHRLSFDQHWLLFIVPYLIWLLVLGLMLALATLTFHKTKKGYRHSPLVIVGIGILISTILGFILYNLHAAHGFEQVMRDHVKPYGELQENRGAMWVNPEEGTLAGFVLEITSETTFTYQDATGQEWVIDYSESSFFSNESLEVGRKAFITGEALDETTFMAEEIRIRPDDGGPSTTSVHKLDPPIERNRAGQA